MMECNEGRFFSQVRRERDEPTFYVTQEEIGSEAGYQAISPLLFCHHCFSLSFTRDGRAAGALHEYGPSQAASAEGSTRTDVERGNQKWVGGYLMTPHHWLGATSLNKPFM